MEELALLKLRIEELERAKKIQYELLLALTNATAELVEIMKDLKNEISKKS